MCIPGRVCQHRRFGAAPEQGHHDQAGQTHFPAYTKPLLEKVEAGLNDPGVVLTHPASLKTLSQDAPEGARQEGRFDLSGGTITTAEG